MDIVFSINIVAKRLDSSRFTLGQGNVGSAKIKYFLKTSPPSLHSWTERNSNDCYKKSRGNETITDPWNEGPVDWLLRHHFCRSFSSI
jgi:hypothetical protein